jgi:hypothetical protein
MDAADLAQREQEDAALVEPGDLREDGVVVGQAGMRHSSPTPVSRPVASITSPTRRVTRPYETNRGTPSSRDSSASTIDQPV